MKAKILILSVVAAAAGTTGMVGGRILMAQDQPAQATETAVSAQAVSNRKDANTDACRKLARTISKKQLSDAQLKKLLKKNRKCGAVVVDSLPAAGAPSIVTLSNPQPVAQPAAQPVQSSAESQDDGAYEDDDAYEGEDEGEDDGDDEGDHDSYEDDDESEEHEGEDD